MSGDVEVVDGEVRYLKPVSSSYLYPAGFDLELIMEGSRYKEAGFAGIPADGFDAIVNNAQGSFDGSLTSGAQFSPYIFTWYANGDMTAPQNFTYYKQGKFVNWAGYFTGQYIDAVIGKTAWIKGVALQNRGIVSGHAIDWSRGVSLKYNIVPNDTGEVAPSASIDPVSKRYNNILGKSLGGTHAVNIEISPNSVVQNWSVNIPAGVDWIATDVTQGSGSGVVNITVSENRSFYDRDAVIQIGGFDHRITQERRSAD